MTESQLMWSAIGGLAAVVAWLCRWVIGHGSCHREPLTRIAALEQRVTGCEEECERLAVNAHNDRNKIGPAYVWLTLIKEKLGLGD